MPDLNKRLILRKPFDLSFSLFVVLTCHSVLQIKFLCTAWLTMSLSLYPSHSYLTSSLFNHQTHLEFLSILLLPCFLLKFSLFNLLSHISSSVFLMSFTFLVPHSFFIVCRSCSNKIARFSPLLFSGADFTNVFRCLSKITVDINTKCKRYVNWPHLYFK